MKPLADLTNVDLVSLPEELQEAIRIFTRDELRKLYAAYTYGGCEFIGIGFTGEENMFTKFANPEKVQAITIIEKYYQSGVLMIEGSR